jgi:hypothetical protein
MKIHAFMLSNKPDKMVRSLAHYEKFASVSVYIHENQKLDFEAAYQELPNPVPVSFLYHNIRRPDKQPPLGAIRFHLFNTAIETIGRRDAAVMVDDDLITPRWAEPGKFQPSGAQSYPKASPQIFVDELEKVAKEARLEGFPFFTGLFNAMAHNGYKPEHPFKAGWMCNMLGGFFKNSMNPFDPSIPEGEDYAAGCKLVDTLKTLPVLVHRGLVPEFEIISSKYRSPLSPRTLVLNQLITRYPWLYKTKNNRSEVIAPLMDAKFRNQLKKTVKKEYR